MSNAPSVYEPSHDADTIETHTLSLLVENEPGALARIVGFFTGRGYNIDSLSVSETDHNAHLSRMTIVTSGANIVISLIKNQLEGLLQVRSIRDLTTHGPFIAREIGLVKLRAQSNTKIDDIIAQYGAAKLDTAADTLLLEYVGAPDQVNQFIESLRPFNPIDVSRSGIAAISSSDKPIGQDIA